MIWGALPDGNAPLNLSAENAANDPAADESATSAENTPKSAQFDDIYFCGDGAAETTHVFVDGNDLPARFQTTQHLQIGELGFGTGLNFLVLLDQWRRAQKPDNAHLSFFSLERYPLTIDELSRAHTAWPQFAQDSARLRSVLPPRHPGFHHIEFASGVTLSLFYGDAMDALSSLRAQIDAWFLDGFSPAKNPDMWSPELFSLMAQRSNPGASFATFTVAGHVRRALSAAGFELERRKGFGKKREMLTGRLAHSARELKTNFSIDDAPWFDLPAAPRLRTTPTRLPTIAIIGGGIAGASVAHALKRHGAQPTIYEANGLASGASGNAAGLIMPRLDAEDTPPGRFHTSAYFHTLRLLQHLDANIFAQSGIDQHMPREGDMARRQKMIERAALPKDWLAPISSGLHFAQGGVVRPAQFVAALADDTPVINAKITNIARHQNQWVLECDTGQHTADIVVIANSVGAKKFVHCASLPMAGAAGQVDLFSVPKGLHQRPQIAQKYWAQIDDQLLIGATYHRVPADHLAQTSNDATRENLETAIADGLGCNPQNTRHLDARASVRCVTPDQMPIIGPVPDWDFYGAQYDALREGKVWGYRAPSYLPSLYVISGFGSRGLVTAPFSAAILAAQIFGGPLPIEAGDIAAIHPARFFVRALKRTRKAL